MAVRFIPTGYLDLERAILLIAKARHPENWNSVGLLEGEEQVWSGLGRNLNSEYLFNHLSEVSRRSRTRSPGIDTTTMINRYGDYDEALQELRKVLFSGGLVAEFIDENGKFDFIKREGWGAEAGEDILWKGVAWLDDGYCRLPLLREIEVVKFAASGTIALAGAAREAAIPGEPTKRPLSLRAGEQLFDEWRRNQESIPTFAQDWDFVRSHGISRERVRELRNNYPRRPRGRSKNKLAEEIDR